MVRQINIDYDIADVVRYKKRTKVRQYEKCSFCGGEGRIKGKDGTWMDCPACEGDGEVEGDLIVNIEIKEDTIRDIELQWRCIDNFGRPEPRYILLRDGYVWQSDVIEKIVSDQDKLAYSD